ncbi:MAG TPA: ankyrin repeat domain-containing protein [Verrucomicrobiae bacterium]|nr:ankyrin repeat domain-containing protein [Verrucomicrobiae bacterium]
MKINERDDSTRELVRAVRQGSVEALKKLLDANPDLARARIVGQKGGSRTLLHVVTDWPGFFPQGPATVRLLSAAGADLNASADEDKPGETPLHWAASSDDVEVAEALVACGANIEPQGGSIAGGTPLENAVGYGCWRVGYMLVNRGARMEKLWIAAAMGRTARVESFFAANPAPAGQVINQAFWHACQGGHRRTAEYLLSRGADVNWKPDYANETALEIAERAPDTGRQALVNCLRELAAKPMAPPSP